MNSGTKAYKRNAKQAARERLILDNIDYARKILSTMAIVISDPEEKECLNSAGMLGLIEAANNFEPSQGIPFRTFAYPRIRGAIIDELRRYSPVSQQMLKQIGKVKKAYSNLVPPVSPEMLAEETGLTLEQIEAVLEAMRFMAPEDWNDFTAVIHRDWKSHDQSPEKAVEKQEMREILAECIQQLPERERLAITLYFSDELNLAEIGAVLSISESRASRVLANAKFRLKELVQAKTN